MIKINFDPDNIPGSLLIRVEDLKNENQFAVKLKDAANPVSTHLRGALSAATRQQLEEHDAAADLPATLRDDLVKELNELMPTPFLYEAKLFRKPVWTSDREKLLSELVKRVKDLKQFVAARLPGHPKKAQGLSSFNRLLLEETYPDEIARSLKAEWEAWNLLADLAKEKVIAEREDWKKKYSAWKQNPVDKGPVFTPTFDEPVWKGFRDWLKENVFHNKCAYCETTITGFPGDTEHFRPKGRVKRLLKNGKTEIVKVVDELGDEMTHPGYFWLAYNWQNLLPSCEYCNTAGGKGELFPLEEQKSYVAIRRLTVNEVNELFDNITQSPSSPDFYYLEPKALDRFEGRLLLHPYYDSPEEHLLFALDGSVQAWDKSDRGEASIKVYNLNERSKVAARRQQQHSARKLYVALLNALDDDDDDLEDLKGAAAKFLKNYYEGALPYAAAVWDFLHFRLGQTRYDPEVLLGERRQKG